MNQRTAANHAPPIQQPAGDGAQSNNVGKPSSPPSLPQATDRPVCDVEFAPVLDLSSTNDSSRNDVGNLDLDRLDSYFALGQESPRFETVQEELRYFKARAYELEHELLLVSNKGKLISQELDLFRQRRVVFWSDRFRNNFDAWNLMNASFQQLKDDSAIFHGAIHKFRLQPSLSLLRVASLNYNFKLRRPGLRGILLAPVLDVPLEVGELCMRLFSAPDTLVASCTQSVRGMTCEEPVLFEFDPIQESENMDLKMRVYVQGVDAPVRVFELRRYSLGGFGRLKSRPFAGFVF